MVAEAGPCRLTSVLGPALRCICLYLKSCRASGFRALTEVQSRFDMASCASATLADFRFAGEGDFASDAAWQGKGVLQIMIATSTIFCHDSHYSSQGYDYDYDGFGPLFASPPLPPPLQQLLWLCVSLGRPRFCLPPDQETCAGLSQQSCATPPSNLQLLWLIFFLLVTLRQAVWPASPEVRG